MSKEFQRIKDRSEVQKQLNEFVANSLPRAVSDFERFAHASKSIASLDTVSSTSGRVAFGVSPVEILSNA